MMMMVMVMGRMTTKLSIWVEARNGPFGLSEWSFFDVAFSRSPPASPLTSYFFPSCSYSCHAMVAVFRVRVQLPARRGRGQPVLLLVLSNVLADRPTDSRTRRRRGRWWW
jgi:hypothetical protein